MTWKIALALDRHVVAIVGLGQRALLGDPVDAAGLDAGADLDAGRGTGVGAAGDRAGPRDLLVEQVLELGPLPLEGGGVHVGDVIGDDIDIGLLREHARRGDGK